MPYLVTLELECTRRRIRDYLCNAFTGYVFELEHEVGLGPSCVTAMDQALQFQKRSGHSSKRLAALSTETMRSTLVMAW